MLWGGIDCIAVAFTWGCHHLPCGMATLGARPHLHTQGLINIPGLKSRGLRIALRNARFLSLSLTHLQKHFSSSNMLTNHP